MSTLEDELDECMSAEGSGVELTHKGGTPLPLLFLLLRKSAVLPAEYAGRVHAQRFGQRDSRRGMKLRRRAFTLIELLVAVRMLELSLQPTRYARANGRTVYTWDYKRLLFGRPIALDVLGIAPIDRLGELSWLGPASVVLFGLLLGLVAHACRIQNYDRWMLLMILGTSTGAYPLMYFAQEFIPLQVAMLASSAMAIVVIAIRSLTIMSARLALFGTVLPAAGIIAVTLVAALHTRLQGILITGVGITMFIVAMVLIPRLKTGKALAQSP